MVLVRGRVIHSSHSFSSFQFWYHLCGVPRRRTSGYRHRPVDSKRVPETCEESPPETSVQTTMRNPLSQRGVGTPFFLPGRATQLGSGGRGTSLTSTPTPLRVIPLWRFNFPRRLRPSKQLDSQSVFRTGFRDRLPVDVPRGPSFVFR